jgi:hypothetical protein
MPNAYNPSYLRGEDQGRSWFEARQGKKLMRPPISTNKLSMEVHTFNPSCAEGHVTRWTEQKVRPYLKKKKTK